MEEFENLQLTSDSEIDFQSLHEAEFENCSFTNIDFTGLSFKSWRFVECVFKQCNFSEVNLVNTTFREAHFHDCRLMGANWTTTKTFSDIKFDSCKLDYSIFQGLDLRKILIRNCSAKDVDFSNSNLSGAIFTGTLLENASFNQADLRTADLRNASRYFIDPQFTKIKGTKVDYPEASSFLIALGLDVTF